MGERLTRITTPEGAAEFWKQRYDRERERAEKAEADLARVREKWDDWKAEYQDVSAECHRQEKVLREIVQACYYDNAVGQLKKIDRIARAALPDGGEKLRKKGTHGTPNTLSL